MAFGDCLWYWKWSVVLKTPNWVVHVYVLVLYWYSTSLSVFDIAIQADYRYCKIPIFQYCNTKGYNIAIPRDTIIVMGYGTVGCNDAIHVPVHRYSSTGYWYRHAWCRREMTWPFRCPGCTGMWHRHRHWHWHWYWQSTALVWEVPWMVQDPINAHRNTTYKLLFVSFVRFCLQRFWITFQFLFDFICCFYAVYR